MPFKPAPLAACLTGILTLGCALQASAGPGQSRIDPGLVLSLGQVHSRQDDTGYGTGYFLDANYTRVFVNFGGAFKDFGGERLANVYVGTGFTGILQLQVGYGTEGFVQRIRHDLNLPRAYDFLTGNRRNRYNQSLGTRFTFTFAAENYSDDSRFDNFHAGFGLLY